MNIVYLFPGAAVSLRRPKGQRVAELENGVPMLLSVNLQLLQNYIELHFHCHRGAAVVQ